MADRMSVHGGLRVSGARRAALMALFGVFAPALALAHGGGEVSLRLHQASFSAGPIELEFEMAREDDGHPVAPGDLDLVHERRLHGFLLDEGLGELRHVHPEFIDGIWKVRTEVQRSGRYRFYAQGRTMDSSPGAGDGEEFTAESAMEVGGGLPAAPVPPVLLDQRSGADGGSRITLDRGRLFAKRLSMIFVRFSRDDGSAPEVQPWLGAMVHAAIVPERLGVDGGSLLHAHAHDHQGALMIHTTFPAAGMYRVWVQFQDAGVIRTVPLAVRVDEALASTRIRAGKGDHQPRT